MNCQCGADTFVKDSRIQGDGQWRKRVCKGCGAVFTTIEQVCETIGAKRGKPFSQVQPVPRPKRERTPKHERPTQAGLKAKIPKHDTAIRAQSARSRIEDIESERYLRSLEHE